MQDKVREDSEKLDLQLIAKEYHIYQAQPELYLMKIVANDNPWPTKQQQQLHKFFKSISKLYNNIPYHGLTHAFDVMTNLDQLLTRYGWQEKLAISQHRRVYMLVAAYAHDSGHKGLTNSYYKNAKHPLSENVISPLQSMHVSNLRQMMRQHQIQIPQQTLRQLTEMVLKTDNFYHSWLVEKIEYLKSIEQNQWRQPENVLLANCVLLHVADLNNSAKDIEISVQWTSKLYIQFKDQIALEEQQGLPLSFNKITNRSQYLISNISFIDHMIIPLFKGISVLEEKCLQIFEKVLLNRQYWQKLKNQQDLQIIA